MQDKFYFFTLNYGVVLLLTAVLAVLGLIMVPSVFSFNNLTAMLQQAVVVGLIAYGLSFVMTSGGLDLSLSGIVALITVLLPGCLVAGLPLPLAVLIALGAALGCGLLNGLLVTVFAAPSVLITCGMFFLFQGLARLLSGSKAVSYENVWLQIFGRGTLWGVPYAIFVLLGVILLAVIVFHLTAFGRYAVGIGSNDHAAWLSGVRIGLVKVTCFMLAALCAGVAGIVLFCYTGQSQSGYGLNFELDALVAVLLGGLSYKGGQIRIFSLIFGVCFIVLLTSLLSKLYLDAALKQVIQSGVMVLAVAYNTFAWRVQDNLLRASGN